MTSNFESASRWCYRGVWTVLVDWFRVPEEPPSLPASARDAQVRSFQPANGFLKYLKLQFWIICLLIDAAIFVAWIVLMVNWPLVGAVLAIPAAALAVLPDIVAYIALHLRFDTTWYVVSDRSLRIRRGIWVIHETTITFENVQNVSISQGPLQRCFGISDVLVETAGGGDVRAQQQAGNANAAHLGLIQGVAGAQELRDQLMKRVGKSLTTGLGDEDDTAPGTSVTWTAEHLEVLREIRDLVVALPQAEG